MEPQVAASDGQFHAWNDPDVARGRRRMPDAQGSVITILQPDYIGHPDGSEVKEFCEHTTENLSSTNTSSKSSLLTCGQKGTCHVGDSASRPYVSLRSTKHKALKHCSTLLPKTQTIQKMVKSEMFPTTSDVLQKEQSNEGKCTLLPQNDTSTFQKNLQQLSPYSDSSTSALRVKNGVFELATEDYACDQCGKRFNGIQQLTRHQGLNSKIKSHRCIVCSKMFSYKSILEIHMRVHSGEKPFECDVCKKTFADKSTLTKHKNIHSGEKHFTCEICNKMFSQLGILQRHRLVHTVEKPFMCEICMRRFSLAASLRTHRRIHTEEKPFTCETCMRKFSDASNLRTHRRIHTKERPYMCEICTRRFTQASSLEAHMRIHTKEKPYMCEICMKRFTQVSSLQRHRLLHTEDKP